jgi:hypothetical protein
MSGFKHNFNDRIQELHNFQESVTRRQINEIHPELGTPVFITVIYDSSTHGFSGGATCGESTLGKSTAHRLVDFSAVYTNPNETGDFNKGKKAIEAAIRAFGLDSSETNLEPFRRIVSLTVDGPLCEGKQQKFRNGAIYALVNKLLENEEVIIDPIF